MTDPVTSAMASTDARLGERLDTLADRGRLLLVRRDRALALDLAAATGLRVFAFATAMVLVATLTGPVAPGVLAAIAIGVSLLAAVIAYRRGVGWRATARVDALALVDRQLDLGDRAVIAEQFLHDREATGFHAAALAEAQPWLERALDRPLVPDASAAAAWRRAVPYGLFGAAMLAGAMLIDRGPGGDVGQPSPGAGHRIAGAAATSILRADGVVAAMGRLIAQAGAPAQHGAGGAARDMAADRGAGMAGGSGGGPDNSAGETMAGATADGQVGTSAAGAGKGGSAAWGDGASAAGSDDGGAMADGAGARREATAAQEARALPVPPPHPAMGTPGAGGWPAAPPPGTGGGGGMSRQGAGTPNARHPSEQGDGGASGSQAGEGKGSGAGTGGEGVKRSRGLAALMLAVPMEDKLVGTPGRGPARTSLRPAAPGVQYAAPVAAESRGMQNGAVGTMSHRPAMPQDEALLAHYFDRSGKPAGSR